MQPASTDAPKSDTVREPTSIVPAERQSVHVEPTAAEPITASLGARVAMTTSPMAGAALQPKVPLAMSSPAACAEEIAPAVPVQPPERHSEPLLGGRLRDWQHSAENSAVERASQDHIDHKSAGHAMEGRMGRLRVAFDRQPLATASESRQLGRAQRRRWSAR